MSNRKKLQTLKLREQEKGEDSQRASPGAAGSAYNLDPVGSQVTQRE